MSHKNLRQSRGLSVVSRSKRLEQHYRGQNRYYYRLWLPDFDCDPDSDPGRFGAGCTYDIEHPHPNSFLIYQTLTAAPAEPGAGD
jgi:hypothetical protein